MLEIININKIILNKTDIDKITFYIFFLVVTKIILKSKKLNHNIIINGEIIKILFKILCLLPQHL